MKHLKYLFVIPVFALFSCIGNSPDKTVREFYEALKSNDMDKAKELTTSNSHSMLNMIGSNVELGFEGTELKNIDCIEEGNTAVCDCFIEGRDKPFEVAVSLENSEWKIDGAETFKKMTSSFLDQLNGIDLNNLDVNSIIEKAKEYTEDGGNKLNELINSIDADKLKEFTDILDSNMDKIGESVEELTRELQERQGKN